MPKTNATRKTSGAGFGASSSAEKNRRSVREQEEALFRIVVHFSFLD
jgi:hypothetical protein